MNTYLSIGNRIMQIILYYGLNKSSFATEIGLTSNTSIVRVTNEDDRGISFENLQLIGKRYPDIDMNWLVMGTGNMLRKGRMVDDKAAHSFHYLSEYSDIDMTFSDATGDSMAPKILQGDILLCKEIKEHKNVVFGDAYRIISNTKTVYVRYITDMTDSAFILSAENQRYKPIEIPEKDVSVIFHIKGIVRRVAS